MNRVYYAFPVLAGILFGSAGSFIRVLSAAGFDAVTIVAQRAVFAAVLLAIVLFFYDRTLLRIRLKDVWIFAAAGICGITIMGICYNIAMMELTMSLAAVLLSIFPIFVFLWARLLFGERITARKLLCSGLAILGCYMVSEMPGLLSGMELSGRGLLMGALTPIFYSVYSTASRLAVERGYQALTITFASIFFMALASAPLADWGKLMAYGAASPAAHWTLMLSHAVCVAVLPYMLFTIGIQHIDMGKAALLSSCEPAAAMVFGAVLFREIPTFVSVAGMAVAIVAIGLICLPEGTPECLPEGTPEEGSGEGI